MDINIEEIKKIYPPYSGKVGGRFKDLSGEKIGKINILYRGENDPTLTRVRVRYVCQCDCGNIVYMQGDNLKQRPNSSCGHCKEFTFNQLTEYENFDIIKTYLDFNDLNTTGNNTPRKHTIIKCKTCGNLLHPRTTELYKSNNIKCPRCTKNNYKIGDKIGQLTLLEFKIFNEKEGIQWKCQCDCGNIIYLRTTDLQTRRTCGKHNNPEDIVGMTFGKLKVLEDLKIYRGKQRIYKCQCNCSAKNIIEVGRSNLLRGHTTSCGCIISKNEENISRMLQILNLSYKQQSEIKNNNSIFKFDFYINNQYFIEFDGEQHFHYSGYGWNTKEQFEKTRCRDLIKNKYCFDNDIPLIRIPYDAEYDLNDLKLETTRFLLTKENEKEYYAKKI